MARKLTDNKWTKEELDLLYKFGVNKTANELVELIPMHSALGISSKIKKLKIKSNNKWTKEELDLLKNNCNLSIDDLKKLIPNRTKKSISKAKVRYGFIKNIKIKSIWTNEEIEILKKMGPNLFATDLAKILPRHTIDSISAKCFKLKIKKTKECRIKLAKYARSFQSNDFLVKLNQSFSLNDLENNVFQVIFGSILGDGCCIKKGNRYIFSESHGWKQKDYVIWKQKMLEVFCPNYTESFVPKIATPSHHIFYELRSKIYKNKKNKNRLPFNLFKKIDYLGLLIWYLDDGYIGRPKSGLKFNGKHRETYPHIVVKGYNLNDLEKVCKIINSKLNLNIYLKTHKHKNGINKIICLNNNKIHLFKIWNDLAYDLSIPKCVLYKLDNERKV